MTSRVKFGDDGTDTNGQFSPEQPFLSLKSVNKTFSFSKNKKLTFGVFFLTIVSIVLIFYTEPDVIDEETSVMNHLGELHQKEQHMNLLFGLLNEETAAVLSKVNSVLDALPSNISLDPDVRQIFVNFSKTAGLYFQADDSLKPPTTFHFLPNLLSDMSSLRPYYHLSKNRSGVSAVIGIPTVKRPAQSYLLTTLYDLIGKMDSREKQDTLIVIFIAEVDEDFVLKIVNDVKSQFEDELNSGLIDIISPRISYYPDFKKLRLTLSDPIERVRWRSKQSLDFAFLMMYCYPKGIFYIQLEDDILAKNNFLSMMKNTALTRIANNQPWFVLDFCQLGFIGKMFRSVDLPWVIQFFFMFFNDKPVDWLLDGLIQTKACNLEKDAKNCKAQKDKLWVRNKPSLFQHIGTTSSLKGKVQNLKDKHFGKIPLFFPHKNPPATITSTILSFKRHTLDRAYNGETFFWGTTAQAGAYISFVFQKLIKIKRYRFKSGNAEKPSDKFTNASVLVHFASNNKADSSPNISKVSFRSKEHAKNDTFVVVASFNHFGVAEGSFNDTIGLVDELKLVLHHGSANWVILSEILIEEQRNR